MQTITANAKRCLVTGSTGFVGHALTTHLGATDHDVLIWPRTASFDLASIAKMPASSEWIEQLQNIDAVIHLAGLAHQSRGVQNNSRYFQINRDGTLNLAAAAQAAGVKRFIFLSSAKVFGEGGGSIYRESTNPSPQDAYAQSKWQAEQQLMERFSTSMEIVILRPPLVYGLDAKANFARLMKLAQLPIPLPFAGIDNKRSMIGIDNLIDLIQLCLTSSAAAGKTLLCADAQPYSLPDIVTAIRCSIDRKPHLFRMPSPILTGFKNLLGTAASARLFGDFQMDCSATYETLNWEPPFTMEQTLRGDTRNRAI